MSRQELGAAFVRELRALNGRRIAWGDVEHEAPALHAVLVEFRERLYSDARHGDARALWLVTAPLVELPRRRRRRPFRSGAASAAPDSVHGKRC